MANQGQRLCLCIQLRGEIWLQLSLFVHICIGLDPVLEEGKPVGSVSLTLTNPDEYFVFKQGAKYQLSFESLVD